ncbi:MAG: TIGR00730 family Rossman fold protein, partial [Planctomycetota bacterium]
MECPMACRSICVFCGSRSGDDPRYETVAREFGHLLAERKRRLVYGGGGIGLMGAVAYAAVEAGGEVTGVIPRFLAKEEIELGCVEDMRHTDDMHERKALMAELSDAFVAMPG